MRATSQIIRLFSTRRYCPTGEFHQSDVGSSTDLAGGRLEPSLASVEAAGAGHGSSTDHRIIAMVIASALFMEHLDATVLATALPSMSRTFGVAVPDMSTVMTAYLVALAIFIPVSGTAADRLGAKTVFRLAIGVFVASSLVCGSAGNLATIVIARFVQGIGGAMMMPVGRLVLLRSIDRRDTVSAMSWLITPAMIGPIVGPPLGGFIVTWWDWRWIFWINLPLGILGIYLAGRFIPEVRERSSRPIDKRGFVLSGAGLALMLAALETAGRKDGAAIAALFMLAGMVITAGYAVHARRTPHPILDLSLFRIPTFRLAVIGGSLTRITQGAQPFLLPLMMQVAFGFSPTTSGCMTLATAAGALAMKGLAPSLLRRFGFRGCLIALGALGTMSYAVCGLFTVAWPLPALFGVMAISGFLMSFQFTAYNTIAFDEIPPARMSAATSLYSTLQQFMLSLGICIATIALHVSSVAHGRHTLAQPDFAAAFWVVTVISMLSFFANAAFDRRAGAGLIN